VVLGVDGGAVVVVTGGASGSASQRHDAPHTRPGAHRTCAPGGSHSSL
jgi:hypothetical protein